MTSDGVLVAWHDADPNGYEAILRHWGFQRLHCRPFTTTRQAVHDLSFASVLRTCAYTDRSIIQEMVTRMECKLHGREATQCLFSNLATHHRLATLVEICDTLSRNPWPPQIILLDLKIPLGTLCNQSLLEKMLDTALEIFVWNGFYWGKPEVLFLLPAPAFARYVVESRNSA